MEGYRKPEEAPPHPLERFAKEQAAYAHLLHYGASEKGAVPHCYGWLECSADDMAAIAALPDIERPWQMMKNDPTPPKALLLEYFSDAERLSIDTITPIVADKALRALYRIHASYILHSDIHGRNVLVLPDGRVVWIDFDASRYPRVIPTSSDSPGGAARPLRRQLLMDEFVRAWVHFYGELVSRTLYALLHWTHPDPFPSPFLPTRVWVWILSSPTNVLGSDTGCTNVLFSLSLGNIRSMAGH